MLSTNFFRRNVVLRFQCDAIGTRLRDVIGVDNMMWGSDYPHSESKLRQPRQILAEILKGVPADEQATPAPDHDPGIPGGNTARIWRAPPTGQALVEEIRATFGSVAAPRECEQARRLRHANGIRHEDTVCASAKFVFTNFLFSIKFW